MIAETTVTFNGIEYPAKEVVLFEGEREEQTVLVAEERLCNVLYNYGIYCHEAMSLDDDIYCYCDESVWSLPEAELIAMLENL